MADPIAGGEVDDRLKDDRQALPREEAIEPEVRRLEGRGE
jgi:hypothetical protein